MKWSLLLSLLLLAPKLVIGAGVPNVVFISDIDDTPKISRMLCRENILSEGLHIFEHQAFTGMPALYRAIANNGMSVGYVSATENMTAGISRTFLRANSFPVNFFVDRKNPFLPMREFKVAAISKVMRSFPSYQFVLLGDNGEHDPQVFNDLMAIPDLRPRILRIYMHRLYENLLDEVAKNNQTIFLTAADLAQRFFENNWINEAQFREALTGVIFDDHFDSLTIPGFAEIANLDVKALFGPPPPNVSGDILTLLSQAQIRIQQRVDQERGGTGG